MTFVSTRGSKVSDFWNDLSKVREKITEEVTV